MRNAAEKALSYVLNQINKSLVKFTYKFPSNQSEGYVYKQTECTDWTEGFWAGIINLAYEFTKQDKYKKITDIQIEIFKNRIDNKISVDHHDLGFLYSLSCVAAYKIYGNKVAKETALKAADLLILRYHSKGEFIQAWGSLDAPDNYRFIIDCLLNLPLLYWATEVTGDPKYREIAIKHMKTSVKNVIRDNFTTHHTFYFDRNSGTPLGGKTHQGYSDDSCWARGQAWGIYGLALSYAYTKDETLIPLINGITDVFISKLPTDNVPYWDMIFTNGSDEPRDTSAAAIAVCGLLEINKHIPNERYMNKANEILKSLMECYTTEDLKFSNGILKDGMYNRPNGDNPECNIWGDYFYMEALMRIINPDWEMYW